MGTVLKNRVKYLKNNTLFKILLYLCAIQRTKRYDDSFRMVVALLRNSTFVSAAAV